MEDNLHTNKDPIVLTEFDLAALVNKDMPQLYAEDVKKAVDFVFEYILHEFEKPEHTRVIVERLGAFSKGIMKNGAVRLRYRQTEYWLVFFKKEMEKKYGKGVYNNSARQLFAERLAYYLRTGENKS